MFKHIVHRRAEIVWQLGPLREYRINLMGIDSANEGGNDCMELIADMDSSTATRKILLDDFMPSLAPGSDEPIGFIFSLFKLKWRDFVRKFYIYLRILDVTHIATLFAAATLPPVASIEELSLTANQPKVSA